MLKTLINDLILHMVLRDASASKNNDFDVWPIVYLLSTSQLALHKNSSIVTYDFDFLSISWK